MIKRKKDRKPTETDWVAMRMLYLVLCGDGSAATIKDVQRTIQYFSTKLGSNFYSSMAQIVAEHAKSDTFKNPESALARNLNKSINIENESTWPIVNDIKYI